MSEPKTETNTQAPAEDIVKVNVALVMSERDEAVKALKEATDKIETLQIELKQAKDLIEEDSKAQLINDIAPMVNVPKSVLALKTREELEDWKKVLDNSKVLTVKSGTPKMPVKDTPEHKLYNMFDSYKAKTWGKNKV